MYGLLKRLRKKPTRNDVLGAVSDAFDGAKVIAITDTWTLEIGTIPPRVIDIAPSWLTQNVERKKLPKRELEILFRRTKMSGHWAEVKGTLYFHLI